MRVVICGDSHIGAVFGLGGPNGSGGNTRVDDYESSLNYIIDYCIENSVDAFVQTGDIFDSRNPDSEHMKVVDNALKRLSKNNITGIVIMGNHDYKKVGSSFVSSISSLSSNEYPNIRTILEPQIVSIYNKKDSLDLLLVPYRDRRMYSGNSTKEDSELYNKEILNIISKRSGNSPILAVGHNFFYEGSYNDFGGAEVLAGIKTFEECSLVVMGHQHNFRVVKEKNPTAIYSGSMEKLNFGDANIDKYFIDYDSKKDIVSIVKTPTRELCDLKVNLEGCDPSDIESCFSDELSKVFIDDKIVRATVSIKENIISTVSKSNLEKIVYDNNAFYVSKIILDPIVQRIVRDTSVLDNKDDFSIFKAFVNSQEMDLDTKKDIILKAKEIME